MYVKLTYMGKSNRFYIRVVNILPPCDLIVCYRWRTVTLLQFLWINHMMCSSMNIYVTKIPVLNVVSSLATANIHWERTSPELLILLIFFISFLWDKVCLILLWIVGQIYLSLTLKIDWRMLQHVSKNKRL